MDHITGATIVRLMNKHHKTIRATAQTMGIPMTRVRYVRANGVRGRAFVMDWMEAITGDYKAGWDVVARAYA